MKKKKGFTLVEVLATLVVLSILLLIAVPSVKGLINKFNKGYYHTLEGTLKAAAIDYYADHKEDKPQVLGEQKKLTSDNLKEYLDGKLKDKQKNVIDSNNAYAIVIREDYTKYKYYGCIKTGDYESPSEQCQPQGEFLSYEKKHKKILPIYYKEYQQLMNDYNNGNILIDLTAILHKKGESIPVSPVKYEITGNGTANNLKEAETKLLETVYGTDFKNIDNQKKLDEAIQGKVNNKYEVDYIYNYRGVKKTVYKISLDESETNPEIEATISSGDNKGYQLNVSKKNDINADWNTDGGVTAIIKQINTNNNTIVRYYCNGSLCGANKDKAKNGSITINYKNNYEVVEVYGETTNGTLSNKLSYGIKTDTIKPEFGTIIKKKSHEWKDLNYNDEKNKKEYTNNKDVTTYDVDKNYWYKGYVLFKMKDIKIGVSTQNGTICSDSRFDGKDFGPFNTFRRVHSEGITTITCKLTNKAGISSDEKIYKIKLDRTPPDIISYGFGAVNCGGHAWGFSIKYKDVSGATAAIKKFYSSDSCRVGTYKWQTSPAVSGPSDENFVNKTQTYFSDCRENQKPKMQFKLTDKVGLTTTQTVGTSGTRNWNTESTKGTACSGSKWWNATD